MKKEDGLVLLLMFAAGALKDNVCGNELFREKVFAFLGGHTELEKDMREEIPFRLTAAWPYLLKIAKKLKLEPLDFECVSVYVLGSENSGVAHLHHNKLTMKDCRVLGGKAIEIHLAERNILAEKADDGKLVSVKFIGNSANGLKQGDHFAFHRGIFVCKITAEQTKLLV